MKHNLLRKEEDSDPISVVSNLFDVAMVFAVALMVALVSRYNMTEVFSQEDSNTTTRIMPTNIIRVTL